MNKVPFKGEVFSALVFLKCLDGYTVVNLFGTSLCLSYGGNPEMFASCGTVGCAGEPFVFPECAAPNDYLSSPI